MQRSGEARSTGTRGSERRDPTIDPHEERNHHAEAKQLVNMFFGKDRAAIRVAVVLAVIVTICNLTEIMKFARIIYLADM